jgi:23S rRNA (guanosine2251-2'-O)-methyltransferase
MAGNSQRRGAMRKSGTKKGMVVGSGGQRRKALKGKGPTPKATERPGHPAARRAKAAAKRQGATTTRPRASRARETVVGRNPVVEALREGIPATAVHVLQHIDSDDRVREALALATESGLPVFEESRADLDRLADGAVHQGIVLVVPAYSYADVDELIADGATDDGLLIALDGVTDPRNLGAIVRSAGAFGARGVIVPERRSAGVGPAAWKASAGALARIPVAQATNLTRALITAKEAGYFVVGLTADGDVALGDLDPELSRGPLILVIGSEGRGLGRLVAQTCDVRVGIPMDTSQESLNASVAAGIVLYAVASTRSS